MKMDNNMLAIHCENPYEVIQDAFNTMISGDYSGALLLLENASGFVGRFYPSGSIKDNDLKQAIELFRYILNNHPEEFRDVLINEVKSDTVLEMNSADMK